MSDLTILENKKEEEKGQLKREKSQEDKPTFKKEEVNIIETHPRHKAPASSIPWHFRSADLKIMTSNPVFFKPWLVIPWMVKST